MHIFGIPRVHRILLCIWFPHHMGVLTLLKVRTRSVKAKKKRNYEGQLSYEVDESDESECGGEGEGRRDSMTSDEAEGEPDGRVTHHRRDHQAQKHLHRRVPVNRSFCQIQT